MCLKFLSKTICNGSSTTLSTNGADSYIWNPGGLTGNSISISPNVTTIYTVTGYWNTTVCTANKSATVTVNPLPLSMSVSPDISVVSGTRITLSASCTDCISYSWSTNYGNYGSLNGGSIKVVPIDSTIYYVSGSNNYNCSISDSIIVSINYYMPNITGLCDVPYGSNTTLTASGIGPFTWYNDQYQGVLLHTGSSFTTPNLYSDTKGTWTEQVSVSITYGVTSISASLDTICGNNYSFLSANVQSGYVNWYTNATGGSPFITSLVEIVLLYSVRPTYFAEANRQEFSQTFNYTGGVQTFTV